MADISQEILDLNARVSKANERLIRAQERRKTLQANLNTLVEEIRGQGYDPSQLKAVKDKLLEDLQTKKAELERQLTEAERQLKSIPE